jgi:hypothetical protein
MLELLAALYVWLLVGALIGAACLGVQREIAATKVGDGVIRRGHWILMGWVVVIFVALAIYERSLG